MRNAWLVAMREFYENARTKGFWIGILTFPLLIWVGISAAGWLERVKPARTFVVVDQSGRYEQAIETAIERLHHKAVLAELAKYVRKHAKSQDAAPTAAQLEQAPAVDIDALMERFASDNPEMVDAFVTAGGIQTALAQIEGTLREDRPAFEEPKRGFVRVPLPAGLTATDDVAKLTEALRPYLRGDEEIEVDGEREELFAAVIVPADVDQHVVRPGMLTIGESGRKGVQYWSANLADDDLKSAIERAVNDEQRRLEFVDKQVDEKTVRDVQRTYVAFSALNPKKQAGSEMVSVADQIREWAPVGFVYLLWIAIFSIAQMLLNNTIEEKSNRLIEVLLSSVTPGELMLGKLVGVAAVGLTMLGAWLISLVLILTLKAGPESEFATQLLGVLKTSGLIPAFVGYFVLGYILYAALFLAIGSVCNTLKEAQNMMQPVVLIMIVPLLTMMFIPRDPNGVVATVLSWIPLYTPFVMMNRAAASPPTAEVIGTTILLTVTTIAVVWLSGKVFKIGILRTGQPPKLVELWRWVRG